MLAFISHFIDMLRIILGIASPEVVQRRDLRKIRNELKISASHLYRMHGNLLLPGFASAVLDFRRLLQPFHEILKETVDEFSNPSADRYWDFLIESSIDEKTINRKERFTFESALEYVHASDNLETSIQNLTKEFNTFISNLTSPDYDDIDSRLMNIRRLNTLCRHPYEKILRHFTTSVNFDDPLWKPQFTAANAEKIVSDLHDFYFILQNFSPSPAMAGDLTALAFRDRLPAASGEQDSGEPVPADGDQDEKTLMERNLAHALDRIEKLIQVQFNTDVLVRILKSAQNDPTFVPRTDEEQISSMKSYRNRQEDRFLKTTDRLRREWKDNEVYKGIQSLFGTGDLLPVKNLTDGENRKVEEDGLGFFTNIMPLRILKSFLVGKYEKSIREIISRLCVEGFFQSKSLQEEFSHIVGECEKSLSSFSAFEEDLDGEGSYSLKTLNMARSQVRQKGREAVAQKIVEGINKQSRTLMESQVHIFTKLTLHIEDFLQDAKSRNPEQVINLRTIGGASNIHFITAMKTACRDLTAFLLLMKHFTYVDDRVFSHAHENAPV